VRRTGALLLLALAGVVLVLFPGLIRELGRRARIALVVASGAMLVFGIAGALTGRFETLTLGQRAMTVAGILLLSSAWIAVVRGSPKR
jgi:hypothetical protein